MSRPLREFALPPSDTTYKIQILTRRYSLLFTGLLINRKSVPELFQWLHTVSFFHAAFEALAVNELRYLQLHEEKYGVNIDVPAAAILSTFGLRAGVSASHSSRVLCCAWRPG